MTLFRLSAAAVGTAALLLASCSDEAPSGRPSESAASGDGAIETFNAEAARLCTEIVNQAVSGPDLPSPDEVYVAVLGAIAEGAEPTAASRADWARELTDHVDAAMATKERLASLVPSSADVRPLWTEVVNAYDGPAASLEERVEALTGGSWVEVRVAFGSRVDASDLGVALTGIGLSASDCANVFTPALVQPPERWRQFTAAAATICTEIVNRRASADYAGDAERVSVAEGQVAAGDEITSPDDVDAALGRLAAEWRQAAEDFSAIDAAEATSPETWRALGDLAAERVRVAEQRRAAIATSNDAAMAAAFAVPEYVHTSFGFELLLLESRSCGGLTT